MIIRIALAFLMVALSFNNAAAQWPPSPLPVASTDRLFLSGLTALIGQNTPLTTATIYPRDITQNIDNSQFNTSTYDAFPLLEHLPNGNLFMCYYSGSAHPGIGSGGEVKCRSSSDGGNVWTSAVTVESQSGYDLRFGAMGVAPNGRIIIAWAKYDNTSGTFIGGQYAYSNDGGNTFSAPSSLAASGFPYGRIIVIGSDKLLMNTYSGNASHISISNDNGSTWGASADVIAPDATNQYAEGAFAYIGGSRIVGLIRKNGGTTYFRQVYSNDNGTSWSDQGDAAFPTSAIRGPAALETYYGLDGNIAVRALYEDRSALTIKSRSGAGSSFSAGVGAWKSATDIQVASITTSLSGYPTILRDCLNCASGIVAYYDETGAPTDADIMLSRMPSQPFVAIPSFLALGVGTSAPSGATMTAACTGGSAYFGINGSYATVSLGIATGGLAAVQACTGNTGAARALYIQPYGGDVNIGNGTLATTGGGGGGYVCIDSAGKLYVKAACP